MDLLHKLQLKTITVIMVVRVTPFQNPKYRIDLLLNIKHKKTDL